MGPSFGAASSLFSADGSVPAPAVSQLLQRAKVQEHLLRREKTHSSIAESVQWGLERDCIPPWDGLKSLGQDDGLHCWRQNISRLPSVDSRCQQCGDEPTMCLRRSQDVISDKLRQEHRWSDCEDLSMMWEALPDKSSGNAYDNFVPCEHRNMEVWTQEGPEKLFVDVGANIGACFMPMAMRQDVLRAVAFEPHPQNLFYLTSSILMNPSLQTKTLVYPYAAGSNSWHQEPLYEANGDAGNVVVGRPLKLEGHDADQKTGIAVEQRLDDVFVKKGKPLPYIHVMKLDAEGYEVKILQGASKLLSAGAINAVKFKIATQWLVNQGSNPAELLNILLRNRYQIFDKLCYDKVSCPFMNDAMLHDAACGPPMSEDFVAIRLDEDEKQHQHDIQC